MDVGADLELRVESEQALSKTHRRGQVEKGLTGRRRLSVGEREAGTHPSGY